MSGLDTVEAFDRHMAPKRERIARDYSLPCMGLHALIVEEAAVEAAIVLGLSVKNDRGTGIVVATDGAGRVFKLEISQVDGPE